MHYPDWKADWLGTSVIAIASATICFILFCASLLSRKIVKAGLWWDDWLIFLALVCCTRLLSQLGAENALQIVAMAQSVIVAWGRELWIFSCDDMTDLLWD